MHKLQTSTSEEEIYQLIKSAGLTTFSISEIHRLYKEAGVSGSQNEKSSRQFVYRNTAKLEKAGRIVRVPKKQGKAVVYTFSAEADKINSDSQFVAMLNEQLDRLRIEFLTTLGEAEFLKSLINCESSWQATIDKSYRKTQEQSTKLLGKIKAAESLLQSCMDEAICV
ncbi:hypothetical protein EYS14_11180 [Alteromonadaceae bacterium M269]|nr:hypothetical protein EYS14_11180 [Alteromonadaceae bacterium M269]